MTASSAGRRAVLPAAGYQVPSNLSEDGLAITVTGEDGTDHGVFDFREAPGLQQLKLQMVAAFAAASAPTGTLRRPRTCRTYTTALKKFLAFTAGLDDTAGSQVTSVEDITPGVWAQWLLSGGNATGQGRIGRLLREVDGLPEATRALIETRGKRPRPASSVASCTAADFRRIRAAARQAVREIELRIAEGGRLLERWRDGQASTGSHEWRLGELLDQLSTTGDLPRYRCGKFTVQVQAGLRLVPGGFIGLLRMLYPTAVELGAMATLLICEEGWNLSVLEEMNIPDQRPDGGAGDVAIHRTEIVKWRRPRSSRFASNNLIDLGPGSPGRAMRQMLAITCHARRAIAADGIATRRLLVARRFVSNGRDGLRWAIGAPEHCVEEWSKTLGLRSDDGSRLVVSPRRLRRSHQVLFGGPRQNTQRTHEDIYLLRDENVRAEAAAVITQGLQDAADHAAAAVRMRMLPSPVPGESQERRAELAGIPASRLADVEAGRLDTATGACLDFEHSPFSPAGPCPASFLLCFACGNAVAGPDHLPRIVYLHEAMTALRSAVSQSVWEVDWAGHYARVGDLLATHTSSAERDLLRTRLTDRDRRLVDDMLARRLDA
ncbi:MAG: hypothetical protein ACRDPY_39820 [Streptosporangiaceae bacterium]